MNFDGVSAVAAAVLYEGYILYPYTPNALKNQQRWTFGGVFPRDYSEASSSDPWRAQVQCIVQGDAKTVIEVRTRFLRIIAREIYDALSPIPLPFLDVDGERHRSWEEAMEQEIAPPSWTLGALLDGMVTVPFEIAAYHARQRIITHDGHEAGILQREGAALSGGLSVSAEAIDGDACRLTVRIENLTPLATSERLHRAFAQRHSFASTHVLLGVTAGAFVSSIDPPAALAAAVAGCANQGLWPVLVGPATREMMLAAPIILYDYPQIAEESHGDLFDGTEIDEILSLRILTMTDEEKRDMAASDGRARALLERTERMDAADFARLHGTMRPPVSVGDRVRLRPRARADIMDSVLADKVAVIEAIERDFEGRVHLAVTVLDDPGRDLGLDRMPGHRFFFGVDEVEPLGKKP